MTNYTDYIKYFEQLAVDFCGHDVSEKHFYRKGLEEFLNGLTTSVNYPALLLDRYDYTFEEHGADNYQKVRTVAFIICDHVTDGENYDSIENALNVSENITDRIFNRILRDITEPRHEFLKYSSINNMRVTPAENYADGNYGYFVSIVINTHHNTAL